MTDQTDLLITEIEELKAANKLLLYDLKRLTDHMRELQKVYKFVKAGDFVGARALVDEYEKEIPF